MEELLLKAVCATSSHEACAELTNLSSIIAHSIVPVQQLHHVRCCLNAEEIPRDAGVWCPKVAQLLDGLDLQCQTLARMAVSRDTNPLVVASPKCTEPKLRRAPKRLVTDRKQVRILKNEGNISRAGAEEMKQVEEGYDTQELERRQRKQRQAENMNKRGCLSENISEVECEGVRKKTFNRKKPMQSVLNTFSPVQRSKQVTDASREEVISLDHDEHVPPHPVASDHCIPDGWIGRWHDPRNEAGINRRAISRLQLSSCRLQARLGSMRGKQGTAART